MKFTPSSISIWALTLFVCSHGVAADKAKPACPPNGYTQAAVLALKANNFVVSDDSERNALALALVPCLADIDPVLRDGIAFTALSTFMRSKNLQTSTATALMDQLIPWLSSAHPDPQGVARPFAVLVLAEVARMDRVAPFMTPVQRDVLMQTGLQYLQSLRDYRGFDEREGWRHGVAHASDLMMQLVVNERVDRENLIDILDAVATQVVPHDAHFYIYGEGERLARPVFLVAQRQLLSAQWWQQWLQRVASPAPYAHWTDVFHSDAGLAKRHNTAAFLNALYLFVQESGNAQTKALLLPLVVEAVSKIP